MFGVAKFRFLLREGLLRMAELVVFFVLNVIARLTSVRQSALIADWIGHHVPRVRFNYMLVDATSYWIYQKTWYKNCWRCMEFVINDELSEWHPQCEIDEVAELRAEQALDAQLDQQWEELEHQYDLDVYESEDSYSVSFGEEDDSDEDPPCTGCGNYDCRGDCEEPDECPGGCGELERNCVCAELASLKQYNATPLEERAGPWTA